MDDNEKVVSHAFAPDGTLTILTSFGRVFVLRNNDWEVLSTVPRLFPKDYRLHG